MKNYFRCWKSWAFPKRPILDSSKLKEFADNNFESDNVLQKGRKICGKRRNCSSRAISPFPTVFSKALYCRYFKNQGLFGIFQGLIGTSDRTMESSERDQTTKLQDDLCFTPSKKIYPWLRKAGKGFDIRNSLNQILWNCKV